MNNQNPKISILEQNILQSSGKSCITQRVTVQKLIRPEPEVPPLFTFELQPRFISHMDLCDQHVLSDLSVAAINNRHCTKWSAQSASLTGSTALGTLCTARAIRSESHTRSVCSFHIIVGVSGSQDKKRPA